MFVIVSSFFMQCHPFNIFLIFLIFVIKPISLLSLVKTTIYNEHVELRRLINSLANVKPHLHY